MGIDFAEIFFVNQNVSDDTVIQRALFHHFYQQFFEVAEIFSD